MDALLGVGLPPWQAEGLIEGTSIIGGVRLQPLLQEFKMRQACHLTRLIILHARLHAFVFLGDNPPQSIYAAAEIESKNRIDSFITDGYDEFQR